MNQQASPTVSDNIFENNEDFGIYVESSGAFLVRANAFNNNKQGSINR
ncbi:MAG: right-handed parallel beta-helix repeat-containing protein [Deinococcales bacterium]